MEKQKIVNETLDDIFGRIYETLGVNIKEEKNQCLVLLGDLALEYNVFVDNELMFDLDYLKMRWKNEDSIRRTREQLELDRVIHYQGMYPYTPKPFDNNGRRTDR